MYQKSFQKYCDFSRTLKGSIIKRMNQKFDLQTKYQPTGDQPSAIAQLVSGLEKGEREQTLLGVTGSGKTFTMANIIQNRQAPTLVLAHNKTLAAQLYSEFKAFFPQNEVHYFVSYFDYYQPEAYISSSDTYIEKDSKINDEIDRLRHAATTALLTHRDTIIVASVSCIYGIGSPEDYADMSIKVTKGEKRQQEKFVRLLTDIQYQRNDIDFHRGTFRVKGDVVDVFPAGSDMAYRVEFFGDEVDRITQIDPLTGEILDEPTECDIFPSSHYVTPKQKVEHAVEGIKKEFSERLEWFEKNDKLLEAQRLSQRTKYDLEMLEETGFVKGIENYSRYLTNREPGQQPATLLDYFPDDFLLLVDESHQSLPQVRGMYNGDRARKEVLVEHGFRLPSAMDNRPLTFDEFDKHINQAIYVSATPGDYELAHTPEPAQQIIRPTGLLDPELEIRPTEGQVDDLIAEIRERITQNQRVLVTTLTKRMAEDLSTYIQEIGIKTAYIHSDVDTLERGDILRDLRLGVYDVLVGINLLREGLDLPEVSMVAIMDADKEGFLRSESALIQTIGRAARHMEGKVLMYADKITRSMQAAIDETNRRRTIQEAYNTEHNQSPISIAKEIDQGLRAIIPMKEDTSKKLNLSKIPKDEYAGLIRDLTAQMELASANLEFEKAAEMRDNIADIKKRM
jgi:excinuclease ABC subunit B